MVTKQNFTALLIQASLATAAIASFAPPTLAQAGLGQAGLNQMMTPNFPMAMPRGIMVFGQGSATAPADVAVLKFVFSAEDPNDSSLPEGAESVPDHPNPKDSETNESPELPELTEADMQPVIAALVKLGIARSAIDLPAKGGVMDAVDSTHKLVLVKLNRPSPERVKEIVKAMEELGLENKKIDYVDGNVAYEVKDCRPVEQAALKKAVQNAQLQAKDLADALGVNLGEMTMVMGMPSFDMTASCGNKLFNMGDFSKFFRELYGSGSDATVNASSSLYIMYDMKKK